MLKNKSEFTKNIITLMTGTAVAQAIPIAISPILTRIYTPEDFGVFALFVAIISILGNIANARYELAIMLPKKDEDAINIFALGFIITCVISIFILILVVIFNDYFTTLLGNDEIGFWLYFVPIAVFFSGMYNVLNYFNNRRKNYKDLRNATILKSIVLAIVQLSIGFIKNGASGLISGQLLSNMFANMKLAKNILKDKVLVSKISKVKMLALAKRYKDFPKLNLPSELSNVINSNMPILLIPKLFSIGFSGYFFLAQKIVSIPSTLIASSISQVYFQKLSENKKNRIINFPFFIKTFKKLFFVALFIGILVYFTSPYFFEIVFGQNWIISGEIAQYLVLIFIISFVVSTLSNTLIVYEKLKILAIWQYFSLITSILLFYISYKFKFSIYEFLFYFVIQQYLIYGIYFIFIVTIIKIEDKKIFESILNA